MRLIALLALLLPSLALAQVTIGPGAHTGPRILGEVSTEYCPMLTHGKCTDGKIILTTRSTPVPCGSGTAGVDVGCYEGGLQCHGQVTNHWLHSSDPTRWTTTNATVSGNTVIANANTGRVGGAAPTPSVGAWTVSCLARSGTVNKARLRVYQEGGAGGQFCSVDLSATTQRFSCTSEITGTPSLVTGMLYVGDGTTSTGTVIVEQCQFEKSSTPGRRCDAGAAPTTCAADLHTRDLSSLPWASGSVSFVFAPAWSGVPPGTMHLIDALTGSMGWRLYIRNEGSLALHNGITFVTSTPIAWKGAVVVRIRFRPGGVSLFVGNTLVADGALAVSGPIPSGVAGIGSAKTGGNTANGTISRLEWSNQ